MHSHQLATGRTFGIRFDPGESFFPALAEFCDSHHVRQGVAVRPAAGLERAHHHRRGP